MFEVEQLTGLARHRIGLLRPRWPWQRPREALVLQVQWRVPLWHDGEHVRDNLVWRDATLDEALVVFPYRVTDERKST